MERILKSLKKQFKVKERIILNIPKKDLKLYNLINKLFENNELIKEIKDRNSKQYFKLINQINIEFEENQNFWKKLNRLRETSSKMILNNENMETSYFGFVKSIKYLLAYYSKEGIGVYQGDPLSPLLFGFITHFLLEKIKSLALHVQMFADDLILLMKGSLIEINFQLQKIFKIIKDFGMNPNDDKTKKTLIPKEILYLGIWLDKKTHLKFNLDKVKANFKKLINILQQKNFSNGLKIQFFKAVLHSQLLYGLEIFDLTKTDFKDIDTWIYKKITKFLLINPHSPRLIYKTGAKIDPVRITVYKRRFKLIQKLKILHYDEFINYLPFRKKESENINWYSKNLKQLENELENFRIKKLRK
ncbi:nuclear intron maturase 1 -related [Anaeramoeba flamelloides]|uniref:Nuclear intron maturase 1 -related n=1 Tax=Anaeramoeba flamelloides TaxID=1746091 RepID=A0AAV7ZXJ6_9EUKA|nr:nuclear intron maturase 1 -related [Anaeramoeba flamelloides]